MRFLEILFLLAFFLVSARADDGDIFDDARWETETEDAGDGDDGGDGGDGGNGGDGGDTDAEGAPMDDEEAAPMVDVEAAPMEDAEQYPMKDEEAVPVEDAEQYPMKDEEAAPMEDAEQPPMKDAANEEVRRQYRPPIRPVYVPMYVPGNMNSYFFKLCYCFRRICYVKGMYPGFKGWMVRYSHGYVVIGDWMYRFHLCYPRPPPTRPPTRPTRTTRPQPTKPQ